MSWVAVGIAGAGLASAVIGSNASQSAASTQADAANNAANVQSAANAQNQKNIAPWIGAGTQALSQIQAQMPYFQQSFSSADFQQDPGYQFRLQEGQKALERAASARGNANSGGFMKALDNYSQGAASQEYGAAYDRFNNDRTQQFNRLASIAGLGQQAVGQSTASNNTSAANVGNYMTQAGASQAAGTVGSANAITGGINSGVNNWMNYQYMQSLKQNPTNNGGYGSYAGPDSFASYEA